jgi:hypothetical protein
VINKLEAASKGSAVSMDLKRKLEYWKMIKFLTAPVTGYQCIGTIDSVVNV